MSLQTDTLLRLMLSKNGIITRIRAANDWPVVPGGDRRKRPVAWVAAADALALMEGGLLELTERGLALSPDTRRRLEAGEPPRQLTDRMQVGVLPAPETPQPRANVVGALSRREGPDGYPLLSQPQAQAAARFILHALLAEGRPVSSSGVLKVDGSRRHTAQEDAILSRMDASDRLRRAKTALGPDMAAIVRRVCLDNDTPGRIDRAESWPRGSALTMLRLGLDRLSQHYGTVAGQRNR